MWAPAAAAARFTCQQAFSLIALFVLSGLSCHGKSLSRCEPVTLPTCASLYNTTLLGLPAQNKVAATLQPLLSEDCSPYLERLLCATFLPPCHGTRALPCRLLCVIAKSDCERVLMGLERSWSLRVDCSRFPQGGNGATCFEQLDDQLEVYRSHQKMTAESSPEPPVPPKTPYLVLEEEYRLDDVTPVNRTTLPRRYDVIDLGDPNYFQGWADVQGQGAANDYCRVLGKGKRKFLSCALAGSQDQMHTYVSKRNLNLGYKSTWFMRDLDGDGRDDYCRCVGSSDNSRISCMKAGSRSFSGSLIEGGSEFSFDLLGSYGCHSRRVNPFHGS